MNLPFKDKTVAVICGGYSSEKEVSIRSGNNIYAALNQKGYTTLLIDPATSALSDHTFDVAFIALHGALGEDGAIQAYFEREGIPYTGSSAAVSALAMNKLMTKQVLIRHGLPTPAYKTLTTPCSGEDLGLPFPVILKPIDEGSSVGVELIEGPGLFKERCSAHLQQFPFLLAETFVPGKEITVSVIEKNGAPLTLPILELRPKHAFYDYQAKYTQGLTDFILPASLDAELTARCQALALQVHRLLGCRGMSRTDMIVHEDQGPFVLEINTIPGMTDLSDLPAQAQHAGIAFADLVELILNSAQ